jgi:hypothetical protein
MILVVAAIAGLFIHENMGTFAGPQYFRLDLLMVEVMAWNVRLYDLLLLCAFLGFVGGMGAMVKPYLNLRRKLTAERAARAEKSVFAAAAALESVSAEEVSGPQATGKEPEAGAPRPETLESNPAE